jgi:hypothetical protein
MYVLVAKTNTGHQMNISHISQNMMQQGNATQHIMLTLATAGS